MLYPWILDHTSGFLFFETSLPCFNFSTIFGLRQTIVNVPGYMFSASLNFLIPASFLDVNCLKDVTMLLRLVGPHVPALHTCKSSFLHKAPQFHTLQEKQSCSWIIHFAKTFNFDWLSFKFRDNGIARNTMLRIEIFCWQKANISVHTGCWSVSSRTFLCKFIFLDTMGLLYYFSRKIS